MASSIIPISVYSLRSSYNSADTWRDPDEFHATQLGVFSSYEMAAKAAEKYRDEQFFNKSVQICGSSPKWYLSDTCSYGTALIIEKINVCVDTGGR
jgi:hypothetical protein